MPSAPATPQEILRRLVLRLILILGCVRGVGARILGLRAQLARMGAGHRHRARLERELARAERYRRMLADPDGWADPGMAGKAAEVARVAGDAGRRALVRRVLWPRRVRRMGAFALAAADSGGFGRCSGLVGGWRLGVLVRGCPPHPTLPPRGGRGLSATFGQRRKGSSGRASARPIGRGQVTIELGNSG